MIDDRLMIIDDALRLEELQGIRAEGVLCEAHNDTNSRFQKEPLIPSPFREVRSGKNTLDLPAKVSQMIFVSLSDKNSVAKRVATN